MENSKVIAMSKMWITACTLQQVAWDQFLDKAIARFGATDSDLAPMMKKAEEAREYARYQLAMWEEIAFRTEVDLLAQQPGLHHALLQSESDIDSDDDEEICVQAPPRKRSRFLDDAASESDSSSENDDEDKDTLITQEEEAESASELDAHSESDSEADTEEIDMCTCVNDECGKEFAYEAPEDGPGAWHGCMICEQPMCPDCSDDSTVCGNPDCQEAWAKAQEEEFEVVFLVD
jgi:hypothetical protein